MLDRPFVVGIPTVSPKAPLVECLTALAASKVQPCRVKILDNGGGIWGTVPALLKIVPDYVDVIHSYRNLGVAASWNLLMKLAGDHDVVLLNDDFIVGPDTLGKLLETQGATVCVHDNWGCVLVRRNAFHQIGDFDERFYPGYFEDDDYRWRMRLAGFTTGSIEDPAARHYDHFTRQSLEGQAKIDFDQAYQRNATYYHQKWGGRPGEEKYRSPFGEHRGDPLMLRFMDIWRSGHSDLSAHLPTLLSLAQGLDYVTEFGTRFCHATTAFLAARPEIVVSYDPDPSWELSLTEALCPPGMTFQQVRERSSDVTIEQTDLLFIDEDPHDYETLRATLAKHAERVNRYIAIHDTETYGQVGQDGKQLGIWLAVMELTDSGEWRIKEHRRECHGLTVLERV